jgi:hypothetical protein
VQRELLRQWPSYGPEWDAAIEFGIDVALLLENLELTPTERLLRHQRSLELALELRRAMARVNAAADR